MEISRSHKSICPLCSFLLVLVAISSIPQGSGITKLSSLGRKQALSPDQGSYLVSQPNGTFIAGFYPVGFNAYAFAIWYARGPNTTLVWMANRDHAVNGLESSLQLMKDGNLVLTDANNILVWKSNTGKADNVAELVLWDTGNLVLRDKNGNCVWQSFDHPTDTLLPGQSVTVNAGLSSRFSNSSYMITGYYNLFFDSSNILSLSFNQTNNSVVYWPDPELTGYTSGRSHYNSTREASMDERGQFLSSDQYIFRTSDYGETPLRRLTLDPDGNLRAYSWDGHSSQWRIVWQAFTQLCKIQGLCGNNALCIDTDAHKPHCACLLGFRMVNSGNWFLGCEPIYSLEPQEYNNITGKINLLPFEHADFYGNDLDTYKASSTLEECKEICMTDSRCKAFAYRLDGLGKCFPKGNLFNGIQSPTAPNTVYVKVSSAFLSNSSNQNTLSPSDLTCPPPSPPPVKPSEPNINRLWNLPVGILTAIAVVEVACIGLGWWYLFKRYGMSSWCGIQGPERFSFAEIEMATNNFSEIIGKGGFGTVYKGTLSSKREVAVKKLQGVDRGEVQFRAEVTIVGRIHHMNLVRMLGFCAEGEHRMLVYEYIPKGSLDTYLFSSGDKNVLQWNQRYAIALGMARGIAYMHEECLDWVLHCDIKPQNILLDENFVPKVSDFGLAKLVDRERTLCFSTIRGTRGYLAPEWMRNLPITAKADVYSFGIVLLEIVSGQNSAMFRHHQTMEGAGKRAVEQMKTGRLREILDPRLEEDVDLTIDWEEVERVVKTALWCIEYDMDLRPSMGKVVEMLQGTVEIPNIFEDVSYDEPLSIQLSRARLS